VCIELEVEETREGLANEKQFNIYETFRYMDKHSRGYIYVKDLLDGLRQLGLKEVVESDVVLLFKRFDLDRSGTLKFSEFSNMAVPS